ncbi:DUF2182 domain-containing protein [Aquisalimonas sp.]|uniref:DUF2182 domain-containing protein n=1 Tax=Aquisalimonas sp. TaxID=1872621 RepID=UPI0025B8FBBD|nr:DUF2182 domain-containing protein [Aquisalimonas sp.]
MTPAGNSVERLLRRERAIALSLLVGVIMASWGYLLAGAGMGMSAFEMTQLIYVDRPMAGMAMEPVLWSPGYAVIMFFMWWVMMIAMMLPSAIPMILLFATVNRQRRASAGPIVSTTLFTASYLMCWAGFSLAATVLHWAINDVGLLAPGMVVTSQLLGAGILLAAGLYQLTPLKKACLRHCRMPALYLATHWRPGTSGAWLLGLRHGAYCLGCCWVLMLLLFFGGVMNLVWITGLALYVLLEKTLPAGHWLDYGLSVALTTAGGWLFLQGTLL